jgi:hypothetical protein
MLSIHANPAVLQWEHQHKNMSTFRMGDYSHRVLTLLHHHLHQNPSIQHQPQLHRQKKWRM